MTFFNKELVWLRVKAFGVQAGVFLLAAIVGAIVSSEFREIVAGNLGTGLLSTVGMLVFDSLIKHLRNVRLAGKFGSHGRRDFF
jgi:hypothetical protein